MASCVLALAGVFAFGGAVFDVLAVDGVLSVAGVPAAPDVPSELCFALLLWLVALYILKI